MSSAQTLTSSGLWRGLRWTAQSAVWRLTAAFAAPLILGAAIFVAGAYVMIVSADAGAVERSILNDVQRLQPKIYQRPADAPKDGSTVTSQGRSSTPESAAKNLAETRARHRDPSDPQSLVTFYRFEYGDAAYGDQGFRDPTPLNCPWWTVRGLGLCLGLEHPRAEDLWYDLYKQDHPGSVWGLARRIDIKPSQGGALGYLYVGRKFAMDEVERGLIGIAALVLGASVFAALLIGFVVSRQMLRRVEEVNAVCDRVQHGDLAARASHETARDEFGELSRHVNAMLDQINSLVHGLRDVSNRIAHDLRTPIARLKAKIEDAADAPTLEAAQAGAMAAVAETQEILETFQALLDIAEVEAGADGGLQLVRLDETARSAEDLYQVVAEEAGVKLISDLEPAPMFGEPSLLVRLTANLVDNAIKFSPRGGEVRIRVERRGGDLALEVQDQGPGVPAEDHETIMRRHIRGASAQSTPGHGLGLALVAAVAKRHGAKIQMSDAGPGLIVRVLFKAA